MSKSIFISHSHKDRKIVTPLVNTLKQANIVVWDSEAEIKSGDSLIDKIQNAIEKVDYLGVVLTKNSCQSNWVLKEVFSAINEEINGKKVKVIPILGEDCDIPYFLKEKLYADIRGEEFTKGVDKLIEILLFEDFKNYHKKFYPYIHTHPQGKKIIDLIDKLYSNPNFPTKMYVNDELVDNPIYNHIPKKEINKLKKEYGAIGKERFRIMPLDLHLIKGNDEQNHPLLLNYFSGLALSGWQTWLFPHRGTDKDINIKQRFKDHQNDLETLLMLNINSSKIEYSKSHDFILSFKPDFGYGGFVLYLFFICNHYCPIKNKFSLLCFSKY